MIPGWIDLGLRGTSRQGKQRGKKQKCRKMSSPSRGRNSHEEHLHAVAGRRTPSDGDPQAAVETNGDSLERKGYEELRLAAGENHPLQAEPRPAEPRARRDCTLIGGSSLRKSSMVSPAGSVSKDQTEERIVENLGHTLASARSHAHGRASAAVLYYFLRDRSKGDPYQPRNDYRIVEMADDGNEVWDQVER